MLNDMDSKMKILLSPKFSYDVADEARKCTTEARLIIENIDLSGVTTTLKSFVYFPVILSPEFPIQKKSARSYSSKEMAEFVNVEIEFSKWERADAQQKVELMLSGLEKAISETSASKIDDKSKSIIIGQLVQDSTSSAPAKRLH